MAGLSGLLQRLKDLYLLVDPPDDPTPCVIHGAVAAGDEPGPRRLGPAGAGEEPGLRGTRPARPSALGEPCRGVEGRQRGDPASTRSTSVGGGGSALDPDAEATRAVDPGQPGAERRRRKHEARRMAREHSLTRWRDRLGITAGVGLLFASIAAVAFWNQQGTAVEAGKKLGEQVVETKKANEKLAEQIKATNKANKDLGEEIIIARDARKKSESEARLALVRLQHSALTEVDSLSRNDPLKAQSLLNDEQVFPMGDRDFSWGYHLALCDWVGTFGVHGAVVTAVSFSPDGRTLATGGDGELRLWTRRRAARGSPSPHTRVVCIRSRSAPMAGCWPPAASMAGCGRSDAATGQPHGQSVAAHEGDVRSVPFSPDGRMLASGGSDGRLRLWDAATGQPRGEPVAANEGGVYSVSFNPDGRRWQRRVAMASCASGMPIPSGLATGPSAPRGRGVLHLVQPRRQAAGQRR